MAAQHQALSSLRTLLARQRLALAMPLVGLTVAGCARQTPSSTQVVAPTTASLPATSDECTARDAAGRTVRILTTLMSQLLRPKARAPVRSPEISSRCCTGDPVRNRQHLRGVRPGTPESQAQLRSMAARASTPEQLQFARAVSMCLPEPRATAKTCFRRPRSTLPDRKSMVMNARLPVRHGGRRADAGLNRLPTPPAR